MSIDSASSLISIPEGQLAATVNAFEIRETDRKKHTVEFFPYSDD